MMVAMPKTILMSWMPFFGCIDIQDKIPNSSRQWLLNCQCCLFNTQSNDSYVAMKCH